MPRGRGHALAIGVLLFWCAIGLADGRRTCLSTRRTARLGCSSKCRADRAERHCQACICAACAFCNSISSTAVQRTSRAAGTGTRSGGDDDSTRQPGQGSSNTGSSEVVAARSRSTSGGNVYRAGSRLVRAFSVATATALGSSEQLNEASPRLRRRRKGARVAATTVAATSAQLGSTRRWAAAVADGALDSLMRNKTVTSLVLRTLGYVPGPQLPLEFGGDIGDFTVAGSKQSDEAALLEAEIATAGPAPRSVRDQRILARRAARRGATPHKVDWHASPIAGLMPGRQARPPTPKARAKRRRKQLLGEVELGGALVGAQNLTLSRGRASREPAPPRAARQGETLKKRRPKKPVRRTPRHNATGALMRGKRQASRKRMGVGHIASSGGGAAATRNVAGARSLPRGGGQKKPKKTEAKLLRKLDADDESSQQSRPKKPQRHRDPAKRRRKKAQLKGKPDAASTKSDSEEEGEGGAARPRRKPKLMQRKRRKPSEPGARKKPRGVKSETENQKMQSQRPPQLQHATKAEGAVKKKKKTKRRRKSTTGDAEPHVAAARRARLRGIVATEPPT